MSTIIQQSTKIFPGPNHTIDIYLWKIENFGWCTQYAVNEIISPSFRSKQSDALSTMTLSCSSNTTTFELKNSLQTSFEITIINVNSSKNIQTTEKNINLSRVKDKSLFCIKSQLNVNLFEVVKLNPSSWLTTGVLTISIKLVKVHKTKFNRPLLSGLLSCLQNEKFSDIVLEANGKELKAHKMILSIKSPVFSAMFDHESMKESRDNRVVIKDIDVDVVKQMLEYIYTGKTPSKIDDCVRDLIGAADKYQIDDLKEICENNLMGKITIDNAVNTLIVADRYDTKELKKKVVEFIKQNKSIFDSAEFKDLESKKC